MSVSKGGFGSRVWYMIVAGGRPSDPLETEFFDWDRAVPVVKETPEGEEALIMFQTSDLAVSYMNALTAEGVVRPGGVQGIRRRIDLRKIRKQFGVRKVAVNPPVEGAATEVIPIGEFAKRLKRR